MTGMNGFSARRSGLDFKKGRQKKCQCGEEMFVDDKKIDDETQTNKSGMFQSIFFQRRLYCLFLHLPL